MTAEDIICDVRSIALVGASHKPHRPSHGVMRFLLAQGFDVIPINPGLAGQTLLGQEVVGRLRDLPRPVGLVDIFRRNTAMGAMVNEALALDPRPRVIWMQLGLRDDDAAARARAAGVTVVMDRCTKIEYLRHCQSPRS